MTPRQQDDLIAALEKVSAVCTQPDAAAQLTERFQIYPLVLLRQAPALQSTVVNAILLLFHQAPQDPALLSVLLRHLSSSMPRWRTKQVLAERNFRSPWGEALLATANDREVRLWLKQAVEENQPDVIQALFQQDQHPIPTAHPDVIAIHTTAVTRRDRDLTTLFRQAGVPLGATLALLAAPWKTPPFGPTPDARTRAGAHMDWLLEVEPVAVIQAHLADYPELPWPGCAARLRAHAREQALAQRPPSPSPTSRRRA